MPVAVKKLWYYLRNRQLGGVKFRRQFPVGQYIIDFYSAQHKLGIEIDGGQHFNGKNIKKDAQRIKGVNYHGLTSAELSLILEKILFIN